MFFDILLFNSSSTGNKSLNQLAVEAKSEHGIIISKQGIDKRFNDGALNFIQNLIEKQLSIELVKQFDVGWFSFFNRVRIKDGTRFDIPEQFEIYLPGMGGSASNAGICIQFEYDLKSGNIIYLNLTPAKRPDSRDAMEVLDNIAKGDLIIRDLGYHAMKSFLNIIDKEAYFISRLHPCTNAYQKKGQTLQELDYKAIYKKMKKNNLQLIHKDVYVGKEAKIPARLVIELLPDTIFAERMRKVKKKNAKKGYKNNDEYADRAKFNLFITNVPENIIPNEVVSSLYRIRWQIELVFKIWKSVIGIHNTQRMKYKRWKCLLYTKLLVMIINWNIIMTHRTIFYNKLGRLLSPNKSFKTLNDNIYRLRKAIKGGMESKVNFIKWITETLSEKHWLEKKNKTLGFEKILYLFYCKSNIYAYI